MTQEKEITIIEYLANTTGKTVLSGLTALEQADIIDEVIEQEQTAYNALTNYQYWLNVQATPDFLGDI